MNDRDWTDYGYFEVFFDGTDWRYKEDGDSDGGARLEKFPSKSEAMTAAQLEEDEMVNIDLDFESDEDEEELEEEE